MNTKNNFITKILKRKNKMRTVQYLIDEVEWHVNHGFGYEEKRMTYHELYVLICHFKNNNEEERN
jgi:hypothetical protein